MITFLIKGWKAWWIIRRTLKMIIEALLTDSSQQTCWCGFAKWRCILCSCRLCWLIHDYSRWASGPHLKAHICYAHSERSRKFSKLSEAHRKSSILCPIYYTSSVYNQICPKVHSKLISSAHNNSAALYYCTKLSSIGIGLSGKSPRQWPSSASMLSRPGLSCLFANMPLALLINYTKIVRTWPKKFTYNSTFFELFRS